MNNEIEGYDAQPLRTMLRNERSFAVQIAERPSDPEGVPALRSGLRISEGSNEQPVRQLIRGYSGIATSTIWNNHVRIEAAMV